MDSVVAEALKYGLIPAILLVVIYLIIQEPDRALKLKALLFTPFKNLGHWFSKNYVASEVASNVNEFLRKTLYKYSLSSDQHRVAIKWVNSAKDPILKKNGTLLLRLNKDDDQSFNILNATKSTLPRVVCPLIRPNMDPSISKSIDLTILKNLSDKLGRHGQLVYRKYFFEPETKDDKLIGELITELCELDQHGFFTTILLNELELIGEGLYARSDFQDYSEEIKSFVQYLLNIVRRGKGAGIELNYLEHPIKVGTILLAISHRADQEGLRPYLRRLRIKLEKGCENVYIIAFPPAFTFFDKLTASLDSYERINLEKVISTRDLTLIEKRKSSEFKIAVLSRNSIFSDDSFKSKTKTNGIEPGEKVKGVVENVSENEALITVNGMRAYIEKEEIKWYTISNCHEFLSEGDVLDFFVKEVDYSSCTIFLTQNDPDENPWVKLQIPKEGDIVSIKPEKVLGKNLICLLHNQIEIRIPIHQVSWFDLTPEQHLEFIGETLQAKITHSDPENRLLIASIKDTLENPWETIHKAIPKGSEFNGKVTEVNEHFVRVEIKEGVNGIIPKESLIEAGHEYTEYQKNVVVGQGLDVYVTKVFIAKRTIRLDLKRNKNAP